MTPPQTATTAAAPPAAPATLDVFLQFEIWNVTTHVFDTLPAGVPIDLIDNDPVSNDTIDTQNTDSQGKVHFSVLKTVVKSKSGEDNPDLFFLAHTQGKTLSGLSVPKDWSTKGWQDKSGGAGFFPKFTGTTLGSAAAPLVFRIGLDFHVRLTYEWPSHSDGLAPKGVPVNIMTDVDSWVNRMSGRTDANGEVHGVTFDVPPGEDLFFEVLFEIEDASINLPIARVPDKFWRSFWNDADKKLFLKNAKTSLGDQSGPIILRRSLQQGNVALYFLKILRELSTFLFHITEGKWKGVPDLEMSTLCVSGDDNAFSWPVGTVNIGADHHWRRDTLIHELSHQIMWKESGFSTVGIATKVVDPRGSLFLTHFEDLLSNPTHALMEGWAEFMEGIFQANLPFTITSVEDSNRTDQGLLGSPVNRGESVEGAFANGLWEICNTYVSPGSATVPESVNGDVAATASWITTAEPKRKFQAMYWAALQELKPKSNPTTRDFFTKMKTMHPGIWHDLVTHLHKYNLAKDPPTIASVTPNSGLPAGGQAITITGTEFVTGTTVTIGGSNASTVVQSATQLTVTVPAGSIGKADIIVTTSGGSTTLAGGYEYAVPPNISLVAPLTGSQRGGDTVTITGTGFQAGITAFFDSTSAASVTWISSTQIKAVTPALAVPKLSGPVDVEVRNPDGQKSVIPGGFNYVVDP